MKSSFMIIFGILMAIATVKGKSYILVILNTYFSIVMLNLKTVNCLFTTTRKDGYLRNIVLVNFFDVIELRQLCVFKNWYQWMTQFLIKYLNFMTRHFSRSCALETFPEIAYYYLWIFLMCMLQCFWTCLHEGP